MRALESELDAALAGLARDGLARRRRTVEANGPAHRVTVDGRPCISFCSNDYLGLAGDPRVTAALRDGAQQWGCGAGAAHLVTGHTAAHHELETALAEFTGRPRALLFSTGYMANLGVVTALAGREDFIAEDRLNHASLIDAARLAGAGIRRYRHADTAAAAARLDASRARRRLLVTDGVFSMDGDAAPLASLADVATANDAMLIVDDAHGLGVTGPGGRGSVVAAGLTRAEVPVLVGTLGKAFGTFGAFVAGSEALVETLVHRARTYIYTTAPPPAVAAATLAALESAVADDWRRARLAALVARFRRGAREVGLRLADSESPIQPVLVGDSAAAVAASEALMARGYWVTAIRPPTVPPGTARLRVTLSATHEDADLAGLLAALADIPALRAAA